MCSCRNTCECVVYFKIRAKLLFYFIYETELEAVELDRDILFGSAGLSEVSPLVFTSPSSEGATDPISTLGSVLMAVKGASTSTEAERHLNILALLNCELSEPP